MLRRVRKEIEVISKNKIEDIIKVGPINETDISHWIANIRGPKDTPYESGIFDLKIEFPSNYPFIPPIINFITQIFHPHVLYDGRINTCEFGSFPFINKSGWSPAFFMDKILIEIINSMKNPILDESCSFCGYGYGNQYLKAKKDRNYFNEIAKEWTKKFAIAEDDNRRHDSNNSYKNDINLLKEEINETIKLFEKELDQLSLLLEQFIKEKKNLINEEKKNILELKEKIKIDQYESIIKLKEIKNQIKINENKINKLKMDIKNEKLIINFISKEENIIYSVLCQKTDIFSKIEELFYQKYPNYKNIDNNFTLNGNKIIKDKSLEDNNIKDNDIIVLDKTV